MYIISNTKINFNFMFCCRALATSATTPFLCCLVFFLFFFVKYILCCRVFVRLMAVWPKLQPVLFMLLHAAAKIKIPENLLLCLKSIWLVVDVMFKLLINLLSTLWADVGWWWFTLCSNLYLLQHLVIKFKSIVYLVF